MCDVANDGELADREPAQVGDPGAEACGIPGGRHAAEHDEHVPESKVEILGHSVGGTAFGHDAHRAPRAFLDVMILPQPTASAYAA